MEGDKKGLKYRVSWLANIIKHGLFLHGVRNNLAKIGLDIMPYYWVKEATSPIKPPQIRGDDQDFEVSVFGENEINYVKNTIIGIGEKDLLADLKNGEICIGLKNKGTIAAYMFIKKKPFVFRNRTFYLQNSESYLHSMYTFEAFRGKRIAPYLRYHSYELLKHQGVTHYFSVSEYFNKSTIKFKNKLNSKPIALYLSLVLLRRWKMNFTLKKYKS